VDDDGSVNEHDVTLSRADHERLGGGHPSPEAFIEACFAFLLERESKESILRSFDVGQIPNYFPDFHQAIMRDVRIRSVPYHTWPLTHDEIGAITNVWPRPEDGALIGWAMWAADGLHHLLDLDDRTFRVWPRQLHGYPEEAVDLAHVRWASASAITTLDLCAATLGRRRCAGQPHGNEYSLRDFDPKRGNKQAAQLRLGQLTAAERHWAKAATTDNNYATVLNARNPMIHGRLKRTVYLSTRPAGPHENRTGFPVGPAGAIVDSRPLIELCSEITTRHLESFLAMIAAEPYTTGT
jgi:hypothetical protein